MPSKVTKNDLSHDKVELDYEALHSVAVEAFHFRILETEKYLGDLKGQEVHTSTAGLLANSYWLLTSIESLRRTAETLAALNGGYDRSQVEIVNKPEVFTEV